MTLGPLPEVSRSLQENFGWNRRPPGVGDHVGRNPVSVYFGDRKDREQAKILRSVILPRPRTGSGREARHHWRGYRRSPGSIPPVRYRVIPAWEAGLEAGVIPRVSFPPGQVPEPAFAEVDP